MVRILGHGPPESTLLTSHLTNMSQQTIVRKELLRASLGTGTVSTVDVREIVFAPGQQTGRHSHPCPVLGYIAEGHGRHAD